jgi:hypothetical protein
MAFFGMAKAETASPGAKLGAQGLVVFPFASASGFALFPDTESPTSYATAAVPPQAEGAVPLFLSGGQTPSTLDGSIPLTPYRLRRDHPHSLSAILEITRPVAARSMRHRAWRVWTSIVYIPLRHAWVGKLWSR